MSEVVTVPTHALAVILRRYVVGDTSADMESTEALVPLISALQQQGVDL